MLHDMPVTCKIKRSCEVVVKPQIIGKQLGRSLVKTQAVMNRDTATGHVTGPYVYNSIVSLCSSLV